MDNRRLMLLIVFSLSLFMLWDAWVKHNQPKPPAQQAAATSAQNATPQPSAALQAAAAGAATQAATPAPLAAEIVKVGTDLMSAEISTAGGELQRLELLAHRATTDKTKNLVLFDKAHHYAAQSGLIGEGMPNHRTMFVPVPGPRELGPDAKELQVRFVAQGANGVKVTKVYTFRRGSYVVDVGYEIENGGAQPVAPTAYFQFERDDKAPEGEASMVNTFTGPAVFTEEGKYQKVTFADIEKGKAKFAQNAADGWLAMVQHYFVAAWLPQGSAQREFYMRRLDPNSNLYAAGIIVPVAQVAPGAKGSVTVPLYAGPQEQDKLKTLAPGLDLVVDYGWLTIIAAPIFWALEFIHKLVGNWGWAIVMLTILIKLAFFPLSAASYKSMAKMRLITPRLQAIKERYGDDRAKLNQEMMELYRKEKINPLGGCLPIVVQIPVFIALYWVLLGAVEMRGAPWIMWITDLSSADPFYVLPVVMMASMLIQTRLNPTPPDPIQAKVMLMMPFIFGAMFFFFPSGLVLYWVVNNVLSIAQQWQITRMAEGAKSAAAK